MNAREQGISSERAQSIAWPAFRTDFITIERAHPVAAAADGSEVIWCIHASDGTEQPIAIAPDFLVGCETVEAMTERVITYANRVAGAVFN